MKIKPWIIAFRLRTLPLALASIGMGSFLAAARGKFELSIFSFCALTTVLLQILSNLANDYGDTVNGADGLDRTGPVRMVQSGQISLTAMRAAIIIFVFLSLISGLYLLYLAFAVDWEAILFFLGLGLLSILSAITYTAGRKPYGYAGLGDLSVLIFFGLIGVLGSYYLFTQQISWELVLPAISCGAFSVAVLNLNNIRDIESDKKAGKYSIPVRIGREKAVTYHWSLILLGIATAIVYTILNFKTPWQLLFLLVLPLLIKNGTAVAKKKESDQLDPYLRQMALTTLLFVLLFGVGLLI